MSKHTRSRGRADGGQKQPPTHLQDAIIAAAEMIGRDGVGKEGLTGYCSHLAQEQPKAFAALLGRVLPMQVTGADGDPFELILQQISGNSFRPKD